MKNLNELIEEVEALEEKAFHPYKWILDIPKSDLNIMKTEILTDIFNAHKSLENQSNEVIQNRIKKGIEYKVECVSLIEDRIFIEKEEN